MTSPTDPVEGLVAALEAVRAAATIYYDTAMLDQVDAALAAYRAAPKPASKPPSRSRTMFTDEQCQLAYAAWFAYHTRPDAPPDHLADHEHESLTAMRLALEAAEQAAWQTIESAPRDGTPVLLWKAITEEHYVAAYINGGCGPGWCTPDGFEILTPTYWRPLPDPPALAKEGGL